MTKKNNDANPYLNARREWNEQYGSYISRERIWRITAVLSLFVTIICSLGIVWSSRQNKLIPYLVEVDKFSRVSSKGFATNIQHKKNNIILAELNQLIEDLRCVVADDIVQKKILDDVYVHFSNDFAATEFLNEYFKKNSPFKRSKNISVTISVSNILQISPATWQVEWIETNRNKQGEVVDQIPMKASISLVFKEPENEEDIIRNPIGLFVKELSWSKILQS